jgi:integrase/recombinase XerD
MNRPQITSKSSMINVTVYIGDGYIKQNGKARVYLIAYVNQKKCRFNTGISIRPEDWDPEKNKIRITHPDAKNFNLVIASAISRLTNIFVKYKLQNIPLTASLLRKEYDSGSEARPFYSFLENAILERKGEITDSSIKQHLAMMSKLQEYAPELMFSEIDPEFLKSFNRWLITKKKNSQNTRHNTLKNLKAYLNIAKSRGLIRVNAADHLPVKRTKTDPVWLTEQEFTDLIALYNRMYLPESHQRVVRHFLFSCCTGLRLSDIKALQMEDIVEDTIVIIAYKTKNVNARTVKIPLCKLAKRLIRDECPHRVHGTVFDMLSEYRTRLYLKESVQVIKLKKEIKFHSGRHTFATLFLKKTKNLPALQKLLGHARIEETMIYTHLLTGEIEQEVKSAFDGFS